MHEYFVCLFVFLPNIFFLFFRVALWNTNFKIRVLGFIEIDLFFPVAYQYVYRLMNDAFFILPIHLRIYAYIHHNKIEGNPEQTER